MQQKGNIFYLHHRQHIIIDTLPYYDYKNKDPVSDRDLNEIIKLIQLCTSYDTNSKIKMQ